MLYFIKNGKEAVVKGGKDDQSGLWREKRVKGEEKERELPKELEREV